MSRYRTIMALAGAAAVLGAAPMAVTHAAQARAGGAAWGKAIEVPGLRALATSALLVSVSCASAGNCVAGGSYQDRLGRGQAFVANERNGRWRAAIEVPGTATLNTGGSAGVNSVSCASPGNCTAGGFYTHRFGRGNFIQAFVASERNGRWRAAIEVPGSRALNVAGNAQVLAVSCASAGNCTLGGFYFARSGGQLPFVASQRNGRWRTAIEVPGIATLNAGVFGFSQVNSVSCASAGNCAVGGQYTDSAGKDQAFVASQQNGTWGTAIDVPGTATLNAGGLAQVSSVSCASAGNCVAGGSYRDGSRNIHAFVASQQNGVWGTAIDVPGMATLNTAGFAEVNSVSCASAGNCVAGGFYGRHHGGRQAFVASQRNGTWGTAIEVLGTATLNAGRDAQVLSLSCASAGNCVAAGFYSDRSFSSQVFVASQQNGRWNKAIEVPGTATLNTGGNAELISVSCTSAGHCTVGGSYADRHLHAQGFVVSRS